MNNDTPVPANEQYSAYVYIIQTESGPIKIGSAANPAQRLAALQTANHEALSLIYQIGCKTVSQTQQVESALHTKYADQHIRGEWFNIDPQSVIRDIEFTITYGKLFHSAHVEQVNEVSFNGSRNNVDVRKLIFEYLAENEDAINLSVRELANLIGVGKTTAAEAKRQYLEQIQ